MEDDWDLHAVVRGYSTTGAAISKASCGQLFSTFHQNHNFCSTGFQDLFEQPRKVNLVQELQDLYKPFFPKPQSPLTVFAQECSPISPLSVLGGLQDQSAEQQQSLQVVRQKQQSLSFPNVSKPNNPTSRSKRRKNNLKRVCHVPTENLSSDTWSWRKYGQKPIKGSPYPRGYYKCSTLKGSCMARKQVERNRSDPGMFIVTYTAEHNHPMPTQRNSLAGGPRQKPATTPNSDDPSKRTPSPVMSPLNPNSPAPDKQESSRDDREDLAEGDDDDNEFNVSNMALEDDFFAGLEDFIFGPVTDNCFADHFPASFQFLGLPLRRLLPPLVVVDLT